MKIINKLLLATTTALAVFTFNSCEESNTVVDEVFDNTTSGAVVRTVRIISDELPIGQSDSNFSVEVEVQTKENGSLVQSLEVYITFNDNTIAEGGTDYSSSEELVSTIPSSEFYTGEFGLPRYTYEITLPEMLSALGVSEANVDGSDTFAIRFVAVMVDGRRFSNGDNSDTSTGSFFRSPFLYSSTVVCPPKAPSPGTWTIEMQDSYGDGWQTNDGNGGDGITITLNDGTVIEVGMCSPYTAAAGTFLGSGDCSPNDGFTGTATFEIPAGTTSADFNFPGDQYGEISFQIITPFGNTVADVGPNAPAGPITIDFCKD
ncbi:hypothetical protein [Flagellimonas sediminis]|uniref:DUF1735 domain-containing protein n=1 Tax=Flagellimonas sediminis TaxID=2696468 RepID=A0A6I5KT06_9FLAO|nr:hypothetical protein [Allomuricauda sediminis]MBS42936.1 hypothetical protein [Nocardioides sp.]NDV43707.1 hypothetical protein [Allomuricauda sediminis]